MYHVNHSYPLPLHMADHLICTEKYIYIYIYSVEEPFLSTQCRCHSVLWHTSCEEQIQEKKYFYLRPSLETFGSHICPQPSIFGLNITMRNHVGSFNPSLPCFLGLYFPARSLGHIPFLPISEPCLLNCCLCNCQICYSSIVYVLFCHCLVHVKKVCRFP